MLKAAESSPSREYLQNRGEVIYIQREVGRNGECASRLVQNKLFLEEDNSKLITHIYRVADLDPGFGAFLTPGSGMGKKSSFETNFWVTIIKFFVADPGSEILLTLDLGPGMEKIRIRDKHPRSATLHI
jgi:hypothetical protein